MGHLFQEILNVVKQIPSGRVATYGQIAAMAGTQNPRLVGFALSSCSERQEIPWFRVVNSKGQISFPEESNSFKIQYSLLINDGIIFDDKNKINLDQFRWKNYE